MTDSHCHPWDFLEFMAEAEEERWLTGTAAAASSWNREQFEYHEGLARKAHLDRAPPLLLCFAIHPQLSAGNDFSFPEGLDFLGSLAGDGRLDAIGETGFDLYDKKYREGEKIQEKIFLNHLEIALAFNLPMVLHIRKAMHKVFPFSKELKKLPSVIFHSWSGTRGEGEAILKRGINAFFSFGTTVLKNHLEAMACAATMSPDRLLLETDAPYQPPRGKAFSSWSDLETICSCIAALRKEAAGPCSTREELREKTTDNFFRAYKR